VAGLGLDSSAAAIVCPDSFWIDGLVVREGDPRLNGPLAAAASAAAAATEQADVTAAVRSMYRRFGVDPTKTRPSSEALLRRVKKGDPLPRINSLVDVVNWCSLEFQLPYGVYDAGKIQGDVTLRLGVEGEEYPGIRKDVVHVGGRLVVADTVGPFGNPTSDSARTMVTAETTRALVVIYAPRDVAAGHISRAAAVTRERVERFVRA
jgi:DNA/RNA-binding domain of Phe-tRNA-synthetase-like protein